jgi:hypothetical protein
MGADPLKLDSKERTPRSWAEKYGRAEQVVDVPKKAERRPLLPVC